MDFASGDISTRGGGGGGSFCIVVFKAAVFVSGTSYFFDRRSVAEFVISEVGGGDMIVLDSGSFSRLFSLKGNGSGDDDKASFTNEAIVEALALPLSPDWAGCLKIRGGDDRGGFLRASVSDPVADLLNAVFLGGGGGGDFFCALLPCLPRGTARAGPEVDEAEVQPKETRAINSVCRSLTVWQCRSLLDGFIIEFDILGLAERQESF